MKRVVHLMYPRYRWLSAIAFAVFSIGAVLLSRLLR